MNPNVLQFIQAKINRENLCSKCPYYVNVGIQTTTHKCIFDEEFHKKHTYTDTMPCVLANNLIQELEKGWAWR